MTEFSSSASSGASPHSRSADGSRRPVSGQDIADVATTPWPVDRPQAPVRLSGAEILGPLDVRDCNVVRPLIFSDCVFQGPILLCQGVVAGLRLDDCELRCGLDCTGASLQSTLALRVGPGDAGPVRLDSARIHGQLILAGTFHHRDGRAISAEAAVINGDVLCRAGFVAMGEVCFARAHIAGELDCTGGIFSNSRAVALMADSIKVADRVCCGRGFRAKGTLEFRRAEIGNQFRFEGSVREPGSLENFGEVALNLEAGHVVRAAVLAPSQADESRAVVEGPVNLTNATFGYLRFDDAKFPDGYELSGVRARSLVLVREQAAQRTYVETARMGRVEKRKRLGFARSPVESASVGGRARPVERGDFVNERLRWLAGNLSGFQPQLYEEVAGDYRRAGHERSARQVLIAMERERRTARVGKNHLLTFWGRLTNRLEDSLLRYGYGSYLLVRPLLGLLLLGTVFFATHPHDVRVISGEEQPPLWYLLYTVELLVPLINLIQRETFVPTHAGAWIGLILSIGGWVLLTLLIAGLTGVLRAGK